MYGRSTKWVQRQLQGVEIERKELAPDEVVIVMDTTYFKRLFGVMVWRCPHRHTNLTWKFLPYETIRAYKDGIEKLEAVGWKVRAIVCDGRRGVLQGFSVPMQMCQFHQAMIVTRYVTRRPKLDAGQDLQSLMRHLPDLGEAQFTHWLELWYDKWGEFLKERTVDEKTKRWHYTHRRIRSAYYSVKKSSILVHILTTSRVEYSQHEQFSGRNFHAHQEEPASPRRTSHSSETTHD